MSSEPAIGGLVIVKCGSDHEAFWSTGWKKRAVGFLTVRTTANKTITASNSACQPKGRIMKSEERSPLVSTKWLDQHQADPDIRLVDVRWRSRTESGRGVGFDDREGYKDGHMRGTGFGDISDKM